MNLWAQRARGSRLRGAAAGTALSGLLLVAACGGAPDPAAQVRGGESRADNGALLNGTEIGSVIPRPALVLQDISGAPYDLRQRPSDRLTAVFFGYTSCPDVCPTTMADLTAARRALPEAARDRVEVVFVTEDPQTDTPAVLRPWLDRFDPAVVGLIGGGDRTRGVLAALKASATEITRPDPTTTQATAHPAVEQPHDDGDHATGTGEQVEHAGSVYVFLGKRVLVYTGGTTPAQYTQDFRQLLAA